MDVRGSVFCSTDSSCSSSSLLSLSDRLHPYTDGSANPGLKAYIDCRDSVAAMRDLFTSRNLSSSAAPLVLITTPPPSVPERLDKNALPALLATASSDAAAAAGLATRTILLALARPPSEYNDGFPQAHVLDLFQTPPTTADLENSVNSALSDFAAGQPPVPIVVVIDSLMPFLRVGCQNPGSSTSERLVARWLSKLLERLRRPSCMVVAVIVSARQGHFTLERHADTVAQAFSVLEAGRLSVHIRSIRRRRSGCVVFKSGYGVVDSRGALALEETTAPGAPNSSLNDRSRCVDKNDAAREALEGRLEGLTFRVGISAEEKARRDSILPDYVHQNEKVADAALELHPPKLQIGMDRMDAEGGSLTAWDDPDEDEWEEFEESEDV